MIRSRSHHAIALAVALGAAALACTKSASNPAGARLRQPTGIAVFQGRTLQNPTAGGTVHPYLAVANAAQNDLAIVDAVTDLPVTSPIKLRTLVYPAGERPTLVAAASLGDDGGTLDTRKPDLLVAASGGDSVLQVVDTWDATDPDPVHAEAPLGYDFGSGHEIVALTVVPSAPGVARIAAILADARVAVVTYRRVAGDPNGAIARDPGQPAVRATPLPFRPLAIAAMPDDGDATNGVQTALYLATQDEIAPGIHGVAELSADDVNATPRALGARGPTRLVAALRLRERNDDPADPARRFAASDGTAFEHVVAGAVEPMPVVQRVYAVLDESGCGPTKRIDCGVVVLDPTIAAPPASIPQAIPPDWAGLMPYRAPMRVKGRPLALAVSGPPALAPVVEGEPSYTSLMRLYMGAIPRATTGVAAVPSDDGNVYFLDLGRFETATSGSILDSRSTGTPTASTASPDPSNSSVPRDRRLWLQTPQLDKTDVNGTPVSVPEGAFLDISDLFEQYAAVVTTPGFTPDESFSVTYQGFLSNDLVARVGEVGLDAGTSQLWLALQLGDRSGGGTAASFTQVARLWRPDLGVAPGDILVFKAAGVPVPPATSGKPTCVGKLPNVATGIDASLEFELRVGALLPPSADHPGGAVSLVRPPLPQQAGDPDDKEWRDCYDALQADVAATGVVSPLIATVRAGELVMLGKSLGYAGRPLLGTPETDAVARTGGVRKPFALAYPTTTDEDQLALACPVADWDGTYPPADPAILTCDQSCRTACETLVLARKVRRSHNLSEDCSTDATLKSSCETQPTNAQPARWPPAKYPFPFVNGPALAFSVAVQYSGSQPNPPATDAPVRDMELRLLSQSGVSRTAALQSGTSPYQANDAIAFDRTPWVDAAAGYRFFVSYPADFVLDATPSQSGVPVPSVVIK